LDDLGDLIQGLRQVGRPRLLGDQGRQTRAEDALIEPREESGDFAPGSCQPIPMGVFDPFEQAFQT
jgi:hypothetical protein